MYTDLKMDLINMCTRTASTYCLAHTLMLLVYILLVSVPVKSQSFQCGQDICGKKGYIICISPPQVLTEHDSYCVPCDQFKDTCDTADEQLGCHLYCRDLINSALQEKIQDLEHHILKLKKDNKKLNTGLLVSMIVNAVQAAALLGAIFVYRCRRRQYGNNAYKKSQSSSNCSATTPLTSSPRSSESSLTTAEEATDASACCRKDEGCYGDKALHNVNPVQSDNTVVVVP